MKIKAKELRDGDKIKLEDGGLVRVNAVSRGFVRFKDDSSIMTDHAKGWSQVPSNMLIEAVR